MKQMWDYIVGLVFLVIIAMIIFKACSLVKSVMLTWKQGVNQIDENIRQSNEVRKDPPNIEQVIINPEQAYTLDPIVLKVSGRKLERQYAHWEIMAHNDIDVPENQFNAIETKYVFTSPGTYAINSQNSWLAEISSSEPEFRQITKYAYILPRADVKDNWKPQVVIDFPKYWVDEDAECIIDASKSYDPDGKISRYFIQFGDGNYREGDVLDSNSLIFHHIYSTEFVTIYDPVANAYLRKRAIIGTSLITNPHYFTLVLYDDKNNANFFSDVIYVLSDYYKENGFLERNNTKISPEEYFNKYLKKEVGK